MSKNFSQQIKKILIASGNKGKIAEFDEYFANLGIETEAQTTLNIVEAIENGCSFVENALIKAKHAARHTSLPVLADDSGLIIDALDGRPGLYSARYAGTNCSWEDNINKVITEMKELGIESSPARFYVVLVLLENGPNDPTPKIYDGTWEGRVVTNRSGRGGFGYDPIFIDDNYGKSAANIFEEKKLCSHRAKALQKMLSDLSQN
ncbi:MAG: RdgB/HAM1 family non-canonical purine NTP pyrophosphatase [Pseudomonadota bacterium]|nr:RdgB/HAM1 family non-canonical purine NTP pyrophosphatase [Pseudomonadota bacterium]